jgi:hypothetical protein
MGKPKNMATAMLHHSQNELKQQKPDREDQAKSGIEGVDAQLAFEAILATITLH